MFPDEKKSNKYPLKKLYFPGKKLYFMRIIDIFWGKKSGEGMINLGDEMISSSNLNH